MDMFQWAVNLSMLFTDVPLLQRFERAAAAGFRHVEFLFPYDEDVDAIERELQRLGLTLVLFNLPAGNWGGGERGIASHPDRTSELREGVERAARIARRLGVRRINCLAGLRKPDVAAADQHRCLVENVRDAADRLRPHGVTLTVEAINTFDVPGFFLSTTRQALDLIEEAGRPNVALQYDVYHMQRMEGNLVDTLRRHLDRIAHVQIADVPGRHQPGTGEINYPFVLGALAEAGYAGYVSLEYIPRGSTEESLREAVAVLGPLEFPRPPGATRTR